MYALITLALAAPVDCSQPICSVAHGEETVVPTEGRASISVSVTENLVDSDFSIVLSQQVERVEVTMRSRTRAAVYTSEGMPVILDGLEVLSPWVSVQAPFRIPAFKDDAPNWSPAELLKGATTALASPKTDDAVRTEIDKAVRTCTTSDTRPCVTAIDAVEIVLIPFAGGKSLEPVTVMVRKGFGC